VNWTSFLFVSPDGEKRWLRAADRPWWADEEEYLPVLGYTYQGIAWELLRRNPAYFCHYWEWKAARRIDTTSGRAEERRLRHQISERFGLDPMWAPMPPYQPYPTIPRFIDEPIQARTELPAGRNVTVQTFTKDEIAAIQKRGAPPRQKKANVRRQLVTYLRLLDAKAIYTPIELILSFVYPFMDPVSARQTYNNHWRAAKRMAESGYRQLAARPWNGSSVAAMSTDDLVHAM
jgi:hypothetical protein